MTFIPNSFDDEMAGLHKERPEDDEPSASPTGYRSDDANLIREGAEAAARVKMFLRGSPFEHRYAVLMQRLEDLANRIER